jgi:hypothetical protein
MGKVKVVPVEQEVPVDIPSDVGEPDVKEELPSEPEVKQESLAIEAPVVEESKSKPKKSRLQ